MKNKADLFTVIGILILLVTMVLNRFLGGFPDAAATLLYVISVVFLVIGIVLRARS